MLSGWQGGRAQGLKCIRKPEGIGPSSGARCWRETESFSPTGGNSDVGKGEGWWALTLLTTGSRPALPRQPGSGSTEWDLFVSMYMSLTLRILAHV